MKTNIFDFYDKDTSKMYVYKPTCPECSNSRILMRENKIISKEYNQCIACGHSYFIIPENLMTEVEEKI